MTRTYNPEFLAVAGLLERREKLQKLSIDILRQEKITQAFLRRFMEETLDAWFDLEEKTELALKSSGLHRELATQAILRADLAKECVEQFMQKVLELESKLQNQSIL